MDKLNNRPRKCPGFKTSNEVLINGCTSNLNSRNEKTFVISTN